MQMPDYVREIQLPERPALRGLARLMDFTGSLDMEYIEQIRAHHRAELKRLSEVSAVSNNAVSMRGWRQDAEAIRGDWQVVGDAMRCAMGQLDKELRERVKRV